MRVSWSGVRLTALAVAATASGYLWRAAFEPSHEPMIIRLAPPALRPELPVEPVRRPLPSHRVTPKHRPVHEVVVRRHVRPPTYVLASAPTPTPTPHAYTPAPTSAPAPQPKPRPKPTPAPTPPTAQPPAQSTTAESAPPTTPQPAPAQQGTEGTETGKPGWGHGDKNHDHGGPPGDGEKHDK